MKHSNRAIPLSHRGVATTANDRIENTSGDWFARFCERQRQRIGYQTRTRVRHYRKRMATLMHEEERMELRGNCGSDHHEDDDE